jgi:hypothetical protein
MPVVGSAKVIRLVAKPVQTRIVSVDQGIIVEPAVSLDLPSDDEPTDME